MQSHFPDAERADRLGQRRASLLLQAHGVLQDASDPATATDVAEVVQRLSALVVAALEELRTVEEELRAPAADAGQLRIDHHAVWEHAPAALLLTDGNGDIIAANAAAARVVRRPAERLRGVSLPQLVPEAERETVRRGIVRLAEAGEAGGWRFALQRPTDAPIEVTASVARLAESLMGTPALVWHLAPV